MQSTRHLDLGCGPTPRNPYQQTELFGVDIDPSNTTPDVTIKQANLALQAIPFPDQYFDSVSAFDFFEHIPRVLPTPHGEGTRFPFIELMNEVHRVLKPGGQLLFCEHGKAPDDDVAQFQARLEPTWSAWCGGCHLTRNIPDLLAKGGVEVQDLDARYIPGPRFATYNYRGRAQAR